MSSRRSSVAADHSYNVPSQNVQKRAEHVQKSVAPDLCKSCNNPVSNEEKALFCGRCRLWQHCKCVGVSNSDYKVLNKQANVMWFCKDDCAAQAEKMFEDVPQGSFAELTAKINLLMNKFEDLKQENQHKEEILDRKIESKVKDVLQEEREVALRKMNLIAFRVEEAPFDSPKEQKLLHDSLIINDIMNELKIDTADISSITRLGKESANKSRPIKLTVKDDTVKQEILKRAKDLKKCEKFQRVFLSPDRTPKQREENKKLVEEWKERKGNGENVRIFRGSVRVFPAQGEQSGGGTAPAHAGSGSGRP